MCESGIEVIVRAQTTLMHDHDVTSETALGLLVWAATDRGVTVLDVASTICADGTHADPRMAASPCHASA